MITCTCPSCKKKLVVYENDTTPGCRDFEDVYCPNCDNPKPIAHCFTSGIPSVRVRE